jgi:hypothetical protein
LAALNCEQRTTDIALALLHQPGRKADARAAAALDDRRRQAYRPLRA